MRNRLALSIGVAAVAVFVWATVVPVTGQTQATARGRTSRTAPRTPWGDPDLQGTYTNTYENGTPFERPDEFAGRKLEDIKGDELKEDQARGDRQRSIAAFQGPDPRPRQLVAGQPVSSSAAARRGSSSIRRTARFRR